MRRWYICMNKHMERETKLVVYADEFSVGEEFIYFSNYKQQFEHERFVAVIKKSDVIYLAEENGNWLRNGTLPKDYTYGDLNENTKQIKSRRDMVQS